MTTFQEKGAMKYTIVVVEMVDSPATLQYFAPYTRTALAEKIGIQHFILYHHHPQYPNQET